MQGLGIEDSLLWECSSGLLETGEGSSFLSFHHLFLTCHVFAHIAPERNLGVSEPSISCLCTARNRAFLTSCIKVDDTAFFLSWVKRVKRGNAFYLFLTCPVFAHIALEMFRSN